MQKRSGRRTRPSLEGKISTKISTLWPKIQDHTSTFTLTSSPHDIQSTILSPRVFFFLWWGWVELIALWTPFSSLLLNPHLLLHDLFLSWSHHPLWMNGNRVYTYWCCCCCCLCLWLRNTTPSCSCINHPLHFSLEWYEDDIPGMCLKHHKPLCIMILFPWWSRVTVRSLKLMIFP